ncbi:aKG-HExxH-type peptide beta-hydroxylase [Streptomyces sp. NPDC015139]|uniref:aKG-HExxH-type peptide beta-hydroxylase n=1 Tax=Streptomyces sp. NPDC015139 TaxID=3364942 RepID=UPI0036F535C4
MAADSLMTSPARAAELWRALGGTPFLADTFEPRTLLSLAAATRRRAAPHAFPTLADYLDPAKAADVFRDHARCRTEGIESEPLENPALLRQLDEATGRITDRIPSWAPLFRIPIRYRHMPGTHISATTALIPQTVFLGTPAFAHDRLLEETLIHEHAHVWLTFVSELCDLQADGSLTRFTLPSGTAGKSLRGVLLAGHFAAAAARYFLRPGADATSHRRGAELADYLGGCVTTAADHPELTPVGRLVHADLAAARELHIHSVPGKETAAS